MANEIATIPSDHEMMVYQTMATSAVSSKMYKGIGEQAGVMMIMLAARELGIPAMQALNGGLNIINGKVEISARMMSALIRKAGHQIKVIQNTDQHTTLLGVRCDSGESLQVTYGIQDAAKARLVKQDSGWTKFPKDMCFARALSRLSRQLFSDVIGIGYVEGEIKASNVEIMIPVDIQPADDKVSLCTLKTSLQCTEEDLLEYMGVVCNHFGWSAQLCIEKFLKEEDLKDKFDKWKSKQEKTNVEMVINHDPLTP